MSIIPKSPSENSEQKKAPSVPQKTRGLFPRDDGWYDVDENGGEKKLATMDDIPNDNNPSVIKNISISKSEDYTNLSIEKKDGTTLNEEFYNKDQANTKFAIKSDIPDVTVLTQEVANIEEKKVDILDIVDDLNTYDSSKPLSANMGALLYSGIPDLVSQAVAGLNLMDYNAVDNLIYNHNVDSTNHSDIRYEIQQIADRLTAFLDTDDTTLDQVSEIVAYINSNKELIDAITTSKVNVVDIVDDLQTSSSDRPLSANQGVQLMSMLNNLALDLYAFLDNTSDGNMYPLSNLIQQIDRRVAYDDIVYDSFDNIPMYNNGGIYNPLSANLGYQLYQNKIGFDKIVTDPSMIWQEDGTLVLSAYYGKILNDYIYNVEQSIPSNMSQLYNDSGYAYSSDIPYNMSQLNNDSYYIVDSSYVHTDNNFTDEYKEKLDNLGENTGGSGSGGISHSWNGTVLTITSDSGTSSVDLKGDKGDPPNVEFHYDEETGNLYYKVDGTLVEGYKGWELVASYTHSENKVVQPTALDKETGYFTCENHGLVTGDYITPFYKVKGETAVCPIPFELLLKANYDNNRLYPVRHTVTVIDDNTFMITGKESYAETNNTNVDVTKFHFETQNTDFTGFDNLDIDLNIYDVKVIVHDFGKRVGIKLNDISSYVLLPMNSGHEYGLSLGIPITPLSGVESYGSLILSLKNGVLYGDNRQYMKQIILKSSALQYNRTFEGYHYDCPVLHEGNTLTTLNRIAINRYFDKDVKPKNGGWIQIWKRKK